MSSTINPIESYAARMPALEQELNDFTYIVTHDLAAAIRHIDGFADILAHEAGTSLSREQNACIDLIRDSAGRCATMLEQLRAYARAQQKPIHSVDCDVAQLLDFVRLRLSQAIASSGAEIEVGPLAHIQADPELLGEALHHILDNAIKFHRADVASRVRIEQVSAGGAKWIARISDNGVGLPEGDQEKLFRMFQRGRSDGAYPGSGAGLTIARRIFRRHGGDVRLIPSDVGACVEASLPCGGTAEGRRTQ